MCFRPPLIGSLLALASISASGSDLAWLDFQAREFLAAPFHRAVPAVYGQAVEASGITFTLTGNGIGARDRGLPDPMLSDFVFIDGDGASMTLEISGLPAGSYAVQSWHHDGGGFAGAVRIDGRQQGAATTVALVPNFVNALTSASYTFTTDGTPYELVFTENDTNNRLRINGLRLRMAGTRPTPPGTFIDIDGTNTAAVGGSPTPFWTDDANDPGFTNGPLWRRRPGFGFDITGNREIFEKDANGGFGDAAQLVTTVTGLTPGKTYGVSIAFISVPTESWQVKGGLSSGNMDLFTPESPPGRVINVGPSGEPSSNRSQYLGFVGNAVAAADGTLRLFADDGDGTSANFSTRSWLEGFVVGDPTVVPPLPDGAVEVAPDGAWTWFNDERAIIHQGSLFAGYVKSNGEYGITRRDLATGENFHMIISTADSRQQDDHNNPSITVLPNGRLMLLYSKHIAGERFFQRTSLVPLPSTAADWGPEIVRPTPAHNTYANTYLLSGEANAIYNFHRSINFNPTLTISTDLGETWGPSRQFLGTGSGSTRPYPRYTSNGIDRIDLIYTDGHPRDVQNSVYHLYYQNGELRKTDGTLIDTLDNIPLDHDAPQRQRGNVIYEFSNDPWAAGDGPDDWIPTGRGWTWDVHYGEDGHPVCVFQVQRDNVTGSGWNHDRIYYYYARWTGTAWKRRFIAHAGRPLYAAEDDYAGGMCLDPEDPRVVYISTNAANPFDLGTIDNVPLRPNERYEIYRGFTADGGLTFTWTQVTENSDFDNLRPIVPPDHGRSEFLVWFHGTYSTYTSFSTKVLARIGEPLQTGGITDYRSWAIARGIDPDAEDGAPAADWNRNGLANMLEFVLHGGADAGPVPIPQAELVPEGLRFSFHRSKVSHSSGFLATPEWSTTLSGWQPLSTEVIQDSGPSELLRALVPAPHEGDRVFVRLKVIAP